MNNPKPKLNDTKKVFFKHGPCSHAFFYILNREFGHLKQDEEFASDPLHGGILQLGYQCGMLWGASLAVGAEAGRRTENRNLAVAMAITATQHLLKSFEDITNTNDCSEITDTDFASKFQMIKFMIFKVPTCFSLSKKWAPKGIQAAYDGLAQEHPNLPDTCMSCASEVAKKMGATDEEIQMVAGFAGGLGLSGNACGALSAAIWMNSLPISRKTPNKSPHPNPITAKTLEAFYAATDYEMLCSKITDQKFETINDHSEYIKNGGCAKLIDVLAQTKTEV